MTGRTGRWVRGGWCVGLLLAVAACSSPTDVPRTLEWALHHSGFGADAIVGATFGADRFVIVGERGRLSVSTNGRDWTAVQSTFGTSNIRNVHFAADRFVAVGADATHGARTISVSADGLSWQGIRTASTHTLRGIAYGGGVWVAVGDDGVIQRSTDLETWESVGPARSGKWISVIYAVDRFVAVGAEESIATSPEGRAGTWSIVPLREPVPPGCSLSLACNDIDDVVAVDGGFVAVTHPEGGVFTSPDLRNWTKRSAPPSTTGSGLWFAGEAYGLTVVGGGAGTLAVSGDGGQSWEATDPGVGGRGLIAFAAGQGRILLGGLGGALVTAEVGGR